MLIATTLTYCSMTPYASIEEAIAIADHGGMLQNRM